jgi:hypothetical protein
MPLIDHGVATRPLLVQVSRRKRPRTRTYEDGQIVWAGTAPVECIIRNLSEGGACLEVHVAIPQDKFDLIFRSNQVRLSCAVVWRQPPKMGVRFF